jgi:hypothetical protein
MKDQFKAALEIQRDGSKQILATMVKYSEANNDSYRHVIARYQKVINELDGIAKSIGEQS